MSPKYHDTLQQPRLRIMITMVFSLLFNSCTVADYPSTVAPVIVVLLVPWHWYSGSTSTVAVGQMIINQRIVTIPM